MGKAHSLYTQAVVQQLVNQGYPSKEFQRGYLKSIFSHLKRDLIEIPTCVEASLTWLRFFYLLKNLNSFSHLTTASLWIRCDTKLLCKMIWFMATFLYPLNWVDTNFLKLQISFSLSWRTASCSLNL